MNPTNRPDPHSPVAPAEPRLRASELLRVVRRELQDLPPGLRDEAALDVALAAAGEVAPGSRVLPLERLLAWCLARIDKLPPERRDGLRVALSRTLMRVGVTQCQAGPVESDFCCALPAPRSGDPGGAA